MALASVMPWSPGTAERPMGPPTHPRRIYAEGVNLVAKAKALATVGLARWSSRFWMGPLPVTMACTAQHTGRVGSGLNQAITTPPVGACKRT